MRAYYLDDIGPMDPRVCIMEGCLGPNCRRCGEVNYRWLGFEGAMARLAKKWGVSRDEAERRWTQEQIRREAEHEARAASEP